MSSRLTHLMTKNTHPAIRRPRLPIHSPRARFAITPTREHQENAGRVVISAPGLFPSRKTIPEHATDWLLRTKNPPIVVLTTIPDNIVFWSDPDRQEGCDSASIVPLSCQTLEEMELQGADISQYEPAINRFFRLKAPSREWTPLGRNWTSARRFFPCPPFWTRWNPYTSPHCQCCQIH